MSADLQYLVEQIAQDQARLRILVNGDEDATVVLEMRTSPSIAGLVKQRLDEISQTYYGALDEDPAEDPSGGAPTVGDFYYNTGAVNPAQQGLRIFNGVDWDAIFADASAVVYSTTTLADELDSLNSRAVYYAATKSAADALAASLPDGATVITDRDETAGGVQTRRVVTSGVLGAPVNELNADQIEYESGTVADKLAEIVAGAATQVQIDESIDEHNSDAGAHPALSAFITSEADRAEEARDAALLSRGLWQTTAQGIGNGVAGTDSLVAGIGGTNGTFDLAFSGGTQVIAPKGYFVVAGGAVTQVVITYAGHYSAGTPTLSFAASSGLTGASATAVMGANTQVGQYFSVPVAGSDDFLILYRVDAGPVATEVARYPAAELVNKLNRGSKSSVILLLPLYPVPEGYTLSGSELFGLRVAYRSDAEGLLVNSFTLGENGFAISAGGLGLLNEVGGIAEVDDPVLSIPDLSPNNYTIAAPAEANAPLLKDDAGAKYLQFDGVDDRLDIPNAAVDRETFTFACSVALTANGLFPTVLGDSSGSNGVFCGFESNNRRPRIAIAGGTAGLIIATSSSPIPLLTRTTIVYMYDGANLTIHVNGSLVATAAASGTAGAGVAARLCYSEGLKAFINLYNCILLDRAVDATERATLEALVESDPMPTSPYDGALIDAAIAEAYETLASEVAAALPAFAATDGVLIGKTKAYAVGDSTVAAFAGGTAIITLVDSPRIDVNVAVPGHTIAQQKTAWLALDVSKLLTGWVIVQIGLNDLNPAEEAAPAIARLQDLINTIRADIGEYRPLLISKMIPCKQRLIDLYGETNGPIAQAKWEDINDAIAGIGPTPITGVDYRITAHVPLMDDGAGNLKPEFDTGDGIHPNTAGRQVNATAWVNALADLGISL